MVWQKAKHSRGQVKWTITQVKRKYSNWREKGTMDKTKHRIRDMWEKRITYMWSQSQKQEIKRENRWKAISEEIEWKFSKADERYPSTDISSSVNKNLDKYKTTLGHITLKLWKANNKDKIFQ